MNGNGNEEWKFEIHFIEKQRIFFIMRLFECSTGAFPITHIPESLAHKQPSIQIERLTFLSPNERRLFTERKVNDVMFVLAV